MGDWTIITFLDFFSGIGGFRKGFELCGMKCIGHCEIDKYADRSYRTIFDVREDEWYRNDITSVDPRELPRANLWAGGFPCQDISVSGKCRGLDGERSGLFFQLIRLLEGKAPQDRPEWIVLENVKNLLSVNKGFDFAAVLYSLAALGYNIEYGLLNSKLFGVPQNRERVYIIAYRHFRARSRRKIFPISAGSGKALIQLIGGQQGKRVYDPSGIAPTMTSNTGGFGGKAGLYAVGYNRKDGITKELDCAYALTASDTRGINRNQTQTAVFVDLCNGKPKLTETARCIKARYNSSITNRSADNSGVFYGCCPVVTPERENKRQNGRRMKTCGEPAFTITAQDRHGVALRECTACPDFFLNPENRKHPPNRPLCGRIRRLTPRECWRLQGFSDELFDKAQTVNSDHQLYRQAGNSVTIPVVYAVGLRIADIQREIDNVG